ncbi:MAG: hypothetical protein ACTTJK_10725 [Phocaeicola sp.]
MIFNFHSIPPTKELCFNEHCSCKDTYMRYLDGKRLPTYRTITPPYIPAP